MIVTPELFVVEADWVVPLDSEPIPNGCVVIANGTIEFVGAPLPSKYRSAWRFHLAGFAILPGLVNAHCHLEFSGLREPLPSGVSFPEWIRQVLNYRNSTNGNPALTAIARQRDIDRGIKESYDSGVRWIVDMATQPWNPVWIDECVNQLISGLPHQLVPSMPIVIQPCFELVDVALNRIQETLVFAEKQMRAPESKSIGRMGYAPHAPYTASRRVTEMSATKSRLEKRLVTMHLAESRDEIEWLECRKGNFRDLLAPILSADYFQEIGQVSDHVRILNSAWRATIAHGNYLTQSDLCELATGSKNMAIVHCPRTHYHFEHRYESSLSYPLAERLKMGVRHFLGTDSRASNPDLNLWSEAKWIREHHSYLPSITILKMITTDAAEFLDLQDKYGALRAGQPSALTAIRLSEIMPPPNALTDIEFLYDSLLASNTHSTALELVLRRGAVEILP